MERVIVCAAKDVARMLTTGTLLGCGLLATTAMSGTMHDVWVVGVIVSVISLFHVIQSLPCLLTFLSVLFPYVLSGVYH